MNVNIWIGIDWTAGTYIFFPPSPYILVFDPPFYVLASPHHMNCRDATIVACKFHCLMYMSYMYYTSSIMHHISYISHHAHHTQNVHGMCHICIYLQLYIAYVHLFTLWQPNMAIEHVVWNCLYKWGLTIQSDSPPKKEHQKTLLIINLIPKRIKHQQKPIMNLSTLKSPWDRWADFGDVRLGRGLELRGYLRAQRAPWNNDDAWRETYLHPVGCRMPQKGGSDG